VSAVVRFLDAEPNGLADMLGRLLEANLAADPGRERLLHGTVVVLEASDAEVAARLELSPTEVRVANLPRTAPGKGSAGTTDRPPAIRIRANAGDLVILAGAPLLLGLPSPFRHDGREVLRRIASGRVRVSGMLRHPLVLSRFARLLSVA
jgi:hypothetical protein